MSESNWSKFHLTAFIILGLTTCMVCGFMETREGLQVALGHGYEARVLEKAEGWR